jgi:hypothetical protein
LNRGAVLRAANASRHTSRRSGAGVLVICPPLCAVR